MAKCFDFSQNYRCVASEYSHFCEKFGKDRPNIKKAMAIFRIARRTIWVLQRPPTITVPPNPDIRLRSGIGCFAAGHMWITSFSGGKHVQYIHDISKCFYTLSWFAYMVSDPDDSWSSGLLNNSRSCMIVCEINLLSTITNND